jgi:hypothetical protein
MSLIAETHLQLFKIGVLCRDKREKGRDFNIFHCQIGNCTIYHNSSLKGTAILILLFLSALVIAHLLMVKKN